MIPSGPVKNQPKPVAEKCVKGEITSASMLTGMG